MVTTSEGKLETLLRARSAPPLALDSYPVELREALESALRDVIDAPPVPPGREWLPKRLGKRPLPEGLPPLIAVYGKKRTGKTLFGELMVQHYADVALVSYSAPFIAEINHLLAPYSHRLTDTNKDNHHYRRLLQYWAQARRFEDHDYIIERIAAQAQAAYGAGTKLVIAAGLREPEEKAAVEDAGGEVWKIVRPALALDHDSASRHYNEIALDMVADEEYGQVIVNPSEVPARFSDLVGYCRAIVAAVEARR